MATESLKVESISTDAGAGVGAAVAPAPSPVTTATAAAAFDRYLLPTEEERIALRKKAPFKNDMSFLLTADIARIENVYLSGSHVKGWYLNYHFYDLITGENVVFPFNMHLGHEDFPEDVPEWRVKAAEESGSPLFERPGLPVILSKNGPSMWVKEGETAQDRGSDGGKPKNRQVFVGITSKVERDFCSALSERIQDLVLEKDVFNQGVTADMMKLAAEALDDAAELACYKIKDPPAVPSLKDTPPHLKDAMQREYNAELAQYEERVNRVKELCGDRAVSIYLARKKLAAARAYLNTFPSGKKTPMFRPLISIKNVEETSAEFKAKDGEEPRLRKQVAIGINLDEGSFRPTEVYFLKPAINKETQHPELNEAGLPVRNPLPATVDDLVYLTPVSVVFRTGKMFTASGQHGFTAYGVQFGMYPDMGNSGGGGGGSHSDASAQNFVMIGKTRVAKPQAHLTEEELAEIEHLRAMQKKRAEDLEKKKEAGGDSAGSGVSTDDAFAMATFSGFGAPEPARASTKRQAPSDISNFGKRGRV